MVATALRAESCMWYTGCCLPWLLAWPVACVTMAVVTVVVVTEWLNCTHYGSHTDHHTWHRHNGIGWDQFVSFPAVVLFIYSQCISTGTSYIHDQATCQTMGLCTTCPSLPIFSLFLMMTPMATVNRLLLHSYSLLVCLLTADLGHPSFST